MEAEWVVFAFDFPLLPALTKSQILIQMLRKIEALYAFAKSIFTYASFFQPLRLNLANAKSRIY